MCPAGETAKGFQTGGICQASAGIEEADETGPEKLPDIPGELHEIYGKLDFMPKDLETLQREMGSNYSLTEVQVQLMRLCMYGAATQVSPGNFCRQGK